MRRSLFKDVIHGSVGFALVSIAAFSVWAFGAGWFRDFGGELGLYAAITVVFLGFSGLVLAPLAAGVGGFYKAFIPAFLIYAIVWTMAWFGLHGRLGEWVGAGLGCVAFAWIAMKMLGNTQGWGIAALALFTLHTAGYFAGDWSMYDVFVPKAKAAGKGTPEFQQYMTQAKLSWGLFYGLGFGAGIGWVFHKARIVA